MARLDFAEFSIYITKRSTLIRPSMNKGADLYSYVLTRRRSTGNPDYPVGNFVIGDSDGMTKPLRLTRYTQAIFCAIQHINDIRDRSRGLPFICDGYYSDELRRRLHSI